jgi:hypothetical protein
MNQSIALFNLHLPKEIIDYICSFNFYSISDCINKIKQHKKYIDSHIKLIRHKVFEYTQVHCILINTTKYNSQYETYIQHQFHICKTCHNYIISSKLLHHNNICFCDIPDRPIIKLLHNLYISFYI